MLAIGEHEDRALHTAEVFLDDHTAGGVAEHAAQHLAQLAFRLVERRQDEHTLAGTEAVGLQHIGRLEGFEESDALCEVLAIEGLVAGRGDVVALHERLGEVLRAFEHSTSLRRSDDGDVAGARIAAEVVIDATHQRVFRSYHHHVDGMVGSEGLQCLEVVDADGDVLAHTARSGIARCDV